MYKGTLKISLFPDFFQRLKLSLTQSEIPWLFPDLKEIIFPDLWQLPLKVTVSRYCACVSLLFMMREDFWTFGLILYIPIIHIYSLLFLRYMLQPIRIRFTALSSFETNIYLHVFLRGLLCTHTNKAVNDQQTKFIKKPFITDFSVCHEIPANSVWPVTKTHSIWV